MIYALLKKKKKKKKMGTREKENRFYSLLIAIKS
jgi:hypothetical protein